jgi:integrase
MSARRSYGTGRLTVRHGKRGDVWVGQWWTDGTRVTRTIGPARRTGDSVGMTRPQAEEAMRALRAEVKPTAPARGRTFKDAAMAYRSAQEARGRKRTTIAALDAALNTWFLPRFGDLPLGRVTHADVEKLVADMRKQGRAAESIRCYIVRLSAIYRWAMKPPREWATRNPVDGVELAPTETYDEVRFLTPLDLEALIGAAIAGDYQELDRALYVTAAMTGLRQGELLGLRWADVDFGAQRIRMRRNFTRGEFDTPKTRRAMRAVTMNTRVALELVAWNARTARGGDDDLVFGHPVTGEPLTRGPVVRRYRKALKAAMLDETLKFHHLRSSYATAMAAGGIAMRELMANMGHADMRTTLRYAGYSPNDAEVELADRAFSLDAVSDANLREPGPPEVISHDLTAP